MSKGISSRRGFASLIAVLALCTVIFGAGVVFADHVDPVFVDGNPTCPAGTEEFKIDIADFEDGSHGDGTLEVTISNYDANTSTFDFETNIGVVEVIVKGGSNGNVYSYDPAETEDTGLHTPFNENSGQNYGLSHVSFCYSSGSTPSPSPSDTETPTPTPTESTPGVTVSPTSFETTPGSSPSVLGTKVLSNTGASVMRLLLAALVLIGLGLASFVIANRAEKRSA